jgi:hypothetical protein
MEIADRLAEVIEEIFRRELIEARQQATDDNKQGLILCERLLTRNLAPNECEFVDSLMRRIMTEPKSFSLSENQARWLWNIYWRK